MPRPKRSKVAPSAPIPLPKFAKKKALVVSAAQKQQHEFSPASSGRVTHGSDDSDGLVVTKKTRSQARGTQAQQYTMSGALALEDIGPTHLRPPSGQTRAAITKIVRDADHAAALAAAKLSKKKPQASKTAEPEQIPSSIPSNLATVEMPSTSATGHSSATQNLQPWIRSKAQETPRLQSSMLADRAFTKRPRQLSLLRMAQDHGMPPEDSDEDDSDDFRPENESTPMVKSSLQPLAPHTSSSSCQTTGSRKRKLGSPELQIPASQSLDPRLSPSSSTSSQPNQPENPYSLSAEDDQPQPALPPRATIQSSPPQIFTNTLAPPESSSPEKSPSRATRSKPIRSSTRAPQPGRRQPSPIRSPISSTSTTASPVRPASSRKPLTTATLQNLLPRRRQRPKPKNDYDIPSSSDVELDNTGLGEDEDESSFRAAAKMRWKKSGNGLQKRGAKAKETQGKRVSMTYTRKRIVESDENENNSDDRSEEEVEDSMTGRRRTPAFDGKAKEEMRRLAEKFREVDEYTLDFEDMTGSSGQMQDAR